MKMKDSNLQNNARIASIILAAGLSSRAAPENKLLFELDGKTIIKTVVDLVLNLELELNMMLIGHQSEKIKKAAYSEKISYIYNPNYKSGMSTSLRLAIENLPKNIDAAFIFLADMPFIRLCDIKTIFQYYDCSKPGIYRLVYKERPGHPVLISQHFFKAFKMIKGDIGAKKLFTQFKNYVIEIPCDYDGIINDVDNIACLNKLSFAKKVNI